MSIFHRYNSTIHGNYRKAYLRCGLAVGLLLGAYVMVRLAMGSPVGSPLSYISDAILMVSMFLLAAWYRNALPDHKVTLKELMLFGLGLSLVASVTYGLALWLIQSASPAQTLLFNENMLPNTQQTDHNYPPGYWSAWWAIMAAVEVLLLGAFTAFLAAIMFRNEKSEIKHKQK